MMILSLNTFTVTDQDITQNECDVTLETMEQDGINLLDDEQTETSRVLKMIMQLDSGACDGTNSTEKLTRTGSDSKYVSNSLDQAGNYNGSEWNTGASPETSDDILGQQKEESGQNCTSFSCPYCRMVFANLEDRHQHAVNHHRLTARFKCVLSTCSKVFSRADDYEAHSEMHPQKAFICNVCNEHVSSMSLLLAHKAAIHRNTFPSDNKCTVCKAAFPDRKELEHHLILSELVHFPCNVCNKVLRSEEELSSHQQLHCEVKPYLCELCGTGFSNNVALQRHRTNHSNARPHKCSECDSSFNKREHLLRHVISKHSDLKPFVCQTCGKSFKRRDKLYEHQRVHGSEKPYACSQCGLRYRYREGLKYHEKTHERDKKYTCGVCSVHFPRPGQLKKHLLDQHNIRSREQHMYPCSLCNMSFSRPERVRRHIERVHRSPVQWQAVCQVCDKGFPGEKSLNTHMAQAHSSSGAVLKSKGNHSSTTTVAQPVKAPPTSAVVQLSNDITKASDAEVQPLYQLVNADAIPESSDNSGGQFPAAVPTHSGAEFVKQAQLADQSSGATMNMIVSKASAVSSDSAEPVTVFMYVHPPVHPNGESVRQTVVAQAEANIEIPLHESHSTALTMNLNDIANDAQVIPEIENASTLSYLPNYDQATSLTLTANPIQYNTVCEVDSYSTNQYGILSSSQAGSHSDGQANVGDQKQLQKQDVNTQSLDVHDQQSGSYSLIGQTSQTLEPPLDLSQLSYKFNVSQDSSATQQLFQLISLDTIQSASSVSSNLVTPHNISMNPTTCQTLSTMPNIQSLEKGSAIQTLSGHVQSNPVLLTPSTQQANQIQSVVHMSQNNTPDHLQTLQNQHQHILQQQQPPNQQQQQQNDHHQQHQLQVVQQQSLLQLTANGQLSNIGQPYSLQQAADITNAVFTPLLNISGSDNNQS
ncbi:hypothetical protein LSH36_101g01007 [Paralvinella palmiformis]|uniref:C2H2-type domain-containing protein n=1 Tax=Paralvinella palmiformis TaxID=53620 RepID=A0AAD9K0P6_9ANNE|nr:hypothetical protein LSH36_101g01007 [Paralvinella palmiformis]